MKTADCKSRDHEFCTSYRCSCDCHEPDTEFGEDDF